jgi:hypothetical protein
MPVQFGTAYTLNAGNTQYEYVRRHTWEIVIPNVIDCTLLAKSVQLPKYELEKGELFHFNSRVKFPMRPTPSDLVVEIYDAVTPLVATELWTWFKQVWNPNTYMFGLSNQFKQQGQVFQYDPVGNLIRTVSCFGLWPTCSPTPSETLDYSDNNPVVINMTFACDQFSWDGPLAASGSVGSQA